MRVRAHRIDENGCGIAETGGTELVIPGLLVGEQADVVVEHESPHRPRGWARIKRRVGPDAPDRRPPACPAYGRCGGCALQHMAAPAQREVKRQWVASALARTVQPVVAATDEVEYRNKGKYVISRVEGELVLGAYEPRSHRVVNTLGCRVVEPEIDALARRLRDELDRCGLSPHDEVARTGDLRYAVIRRGGDGGVLIIVVTRSTTARAPIAAVAAAVEPARLVWMRNDATSGRVLADDWEPVSGDPWVEEVLSGVAVRVGPADFFQLNRAQAGRLYQRVAELSGAGPGTNAVDLYGGLGGFSFALARRGARVVGIEAQPGAVASASAAASAAGLGDQVRFVCADANRIADHAAGADVVVVNPPRRGLSEPVRRELMALGSPTLIYVSCNPVTLARDLTALEASWDVVAVEPFDLMPGATPVETVVALRHRA